MEGEAFVLRTIPSIDDDEDNNNDDDKLQEQQKNRQQKKQLHGDDGDDDIGYKHYGLDNDSVNSGCRTDEQLFFRNRRVFAPPGKRGYLFKWQDRTIGWGGTKWALRFVSLEAGKISYYRSHNIDNDPSPRYVLSLRGCAVRDDGWKMNPRYRPKRTSGKIVHPPPMDEPGAYFHVFSIYQHPNSMMMMNHHNGTTRRRRSSRTEQDTGGGCDNGDDDEEDEVVSLLRFSTPSLAEKNQWIQLISESCAYCESDQFLLQEEKRAAELDRQLEEQRRMKMAMPEARPGTLPPLYFAPKLLSSRNLMRNVSGGSLGAGAGTGSASLRASTSGSSLKGTPSKPTGRLFRSKSKEIKDKNGEKSLNWTKGYPPSKPMHRSSGVSYLSPEAPVQNYRGLFNLAMIILVVSNFRLILATIRTHGFALRKFKEHVWNDAQRRSFLDFFLMKHQEQVSWDVDFLLFGFILQNGFIIIAFIIEWFLSRNNSTETITTDTSSKNNDSGDNTDTNPSDSDRNSTNNKNNNDNEHDVNTTTNDRIESIGMIFHYINAHISFALCCSIVWNQIKNPAIGSILLVQGTITWMKLLSYIHANQDYRTGLVDSHQATLALIENLDPSDEQLYYPINITLGNLYYFWFAPTLTYQIAFPKTEKVRFWYVIGILLRLLLCLALFTFLLAQVVSPALNNLMNELEGTHGVYTPHIMAEYWLKLSITNTYLWLLFFYAYFHLILNLFAELLRFGDRAFYKDWWNSSEVSSYWRLWNLPVHYWLIRHIYFPCVRKCRSRMMATFIVFFLSAVLHEVLVSLPFHMIRPWSFLGMMMQIPLVGITKYFDQCYPGSSIGNIIFWITFCVVGQPMAIMLYAVDYQLMMKASATHQEEPFSSSSLPDEL